MLETIRLWLNSKRDYKTGIVLYSQLSNNEQLISLFLKVKSTYTVNRLASELQQIFNSLKNEKDLPTTAVDRRASTKIPSIHQSTISSRSTGNQGSHIGEADHSLPPVEEAENKLYQACKNEANKAYKEAMNLRAELFALTRVEDWQDPNQPDMVAKRSKLAIDVVNKYNHASRLYDDADFAKLYGRLRNPGSDEDEEIDFHSIPDIMVKQTLDNLRKNFNKIKTKEMTARRQLSYDSHVAGIKILTERWHLLRPVNQ
jgi:hypothetical protein